MDPEMQAWILKGHLDWLAGASWLTRWTHKLFGRCRACKELRRIIPGINL
jgi:hypothetical protein